VIGAGAGFQANGSKAAREFSLTLKTDKGKVLLKFQEALLTEDEARRIAANICEAARTLDQGNQDIGVTYANNLRFR